MSLIPVMPTHTWTTIRFLPPNGEGYWDFDGHLHVLLLAGDEPFMWELVFRDEDPPPPPDRQVRMMPDQWAKIGGGRLYLETNTIYNDSKHWQIRVEGDQAIVEQYRRQ